ncbi:hypothetical protein EAO77_36955 [Streptomyces sp. t39]|nr:hypothetical protein EAO77_36955 [Streptomyces sp. t39]
MRRSRVAELCRARPRAWLAGLRRAVVEPCWRTSAAGRALVGELARAVPVTLGESGAAGTGGHPPPPEG